MSSACSETEAAPAAAERVWEAPRVIQAVCLACCAGLLGAAVWLKPDPRGLGTHEQLHFPPCTLHRVTGVPCPGCGMTTAFAAAVRFQFVAAFWANPLGLLLCAGVALFGLFSLACLVTNWRAWSLLRRLESPRFLWPVFALLLASWAFKIAATLAQLH
jgi:hypothetical protein